MTLATKRANTFAHGFLASALSNSGNEWLSFDGPSLKSSSICSIEGDPPAPTDDGPKFTQKDFDAALGKRLADERKKFADYDAVKAQASKVSELEAALAALQEENTLRGKSAEEKQKHEAEKAAKALERERAEYAAKLAAAEKKGGDAETKLRNHIVAAALGGGLDAAKVLSTARADAVRLLQQEATVELDDDGKIVSVTYGGVAHKSPAEAAAAFLKDKEYLASARGVGGGTGTQRPNSGGNQQDVFKASAEENFAAGLRAPPTKIPGLDFGL